MFHLIHDTALLALSASDINAPHEETAKAVGEEIAAATGLPQTQCASVVFSALASHAPLPTVAVRCANTLCQTQLV